MKRKGWLPSNFAASCLQTNPKKHHGTLVGKGGHRLLYEQPCSPRQCQTSKALSNNHFSYYLYHTTSHSVLSSSHRGEIPVRAEARSASHQQSFKLLEHLIKHTRHILVIRIPNQLLIQLIPAQGTRLASRRTKVGPVGFGFEFRVYDLAP